MKSAGQTVIFDYFKALIPLGDGLGFHSEDIQSICASGPPTVIVCDLELIHQHASLKMCHPC